MRYWDKEEKYTSGKMALTEGEIEKLLDKITHLEEQTLLMLAINGGFRREDLVNIEMQNVEKMENGYLIRYYEQKKKRMWKAYISGNTAKILTQHINSLPKGTTYLFPSPLKTRKNKHLSSRYAYSVYNKWLKVAGLEKRPFHTLRSTCIKLAIKRGWTMAQICELTGDKPETIEQHYTTASDGEMRELKAIL